MSDTSPLLMNMGAEVAKAAGMHANPAGTRSTGGENDEFAGILHSVLTPDSKPIEAKPLIAIQAESDPLLLSQLEGLTDQLLQQRMVGLEALPDGKLLPDTEQELAWQAMLTEYDSENHDTPRVIIAAGGREGELVEEFTPEELLQSLSLDETRSVNNSPVTMLKDDLVMDANTELDDESPLAVIPLTAQAEIIDNQDSGKLVRPELGEAAKELTSIEGKQAQLNTEEGSSVRRAKLQVGQSVAPDKKSSSVEDLLTKSIDTHKDTTDPNLFKAELNAAQDNLAAKQVGSSLNGTNSAVAATAYSAVSGLGSASSSTPSPGPVIANMTIPPQNPSWGEVIGDRVQWMTTQNIHEAKIQLNPPELGMLEVRVRVGVDQQTSISFSSPHAQVRDALETAVPRLREMFAGNGLSLGDVNVSHHSMAGHGQNGQGEYRSTSSGKNFSSMPDETSNVVAMPRPVSQGSGMLDLYA